MRPLPRTVCLALTGVLALSLLPAAQAWTLDASGPRSPGGDSTSDGVAAHARAAAAAWTTDLATPVAVPTDALAALPQAAACALGDVTGDGIADLAVLVDAAGGTVTLEARAGPTFEEVVWRVPTRLERVLQCAPDLDLDGTLDPIIRTFGEVQGTVAGAGAAADQARNVVQQTLDGATGAALVGRVDPQAATGVAAQGVEAAQNATTLLLPAAEGTVAMLSGSASAATAQLPVPLPVPGGVPLDALDLRAAQEASLQILDITGSVVATVEVAEAGVQPLALAPVQLSGALPDIAVLSQVTGPVQDAAAGVPELALYAADGTLAWTTQLPPVTGVPMLVPNAGDLDLDGVGDLVVTTVEQPLQAVPGAAYTVLSGVDGSILFDSGPAVTGLLSALPLGDLPDGPALLEAALAEGAGRLTLRVLDGAGQVQWATDVDALARPVNQVLDAYTGDVLGFTDLTGDAVADVAVATILDPAVARGAGDLRVTVLDGLTGDVAWNATIPDASAIVPVVIGPAQLLDGNDPDERDDQAAKLEGTNKSTAVAELPGLDGVVDGVEEAAVGKASLLLAIGNGSANATLTLIEGLTGEVLWTADAALPSLPLASLTANVAGDLTGDQVQDLLVTAQLDGADDEAPALVAAVSGATGETVWSNATASAAGQPSLDFGSSFGPASADAREASQGAPGPAPLMTAGAALAAVALLRRRR